MPFFRSSFTLVLLVCCCPLNIAFFYQPFTVRIPSANSPKGFLSNSACLVLQRSYHQQVFSSSSATDHGSSGQLLRRRFSSFILPLWKLFQWFRSILLTTLVAGCFFLARGPVMAHAASGGSFSGSSFQQTTSSSSSSSSRSQRSDNSRRYVGSSSSSSSTNFYFGRPSSPRYSTTAHGMMLRPESSVVRTAPMSVLVQLITIISVTMFVVPRLKTTVMAQLGLEASALSQVQLLLRLSREDLQQLLMSLQNILSVDLADQPPITLAERTERLCASLLRRQNTIVGGSMQQQRWSYGGSGGFQTAQESFHRLSLDERVKFDDEAAMLLSKSPAIINNNSNNNEQSGSAAATTCAVVTVLLLSRGPVLRSRGWSGFHESGTRKRLLAREDLVDFLYRLSAYCRKLDVLQQREQQRRRRKEENGSGSGSSSSSSSSESPLQLLPGYEIKVLWTPNSAAETISEASVAETWPTLRAV